MRLSRTAVLERLKSTLASLDTGGSCELLSLAQEQRLGGVKVLVVKASFGQGKRLTPIQVA